MQWAPYQRRFLKAVDDPRWRTVAASWPRGAGKTTCAGWIVARALTPGDPLFVAGGEIVLFAGSIEQCRLTYRQALGFLESRLGDYRLVDSATRVAITHKASRTRLKAVGSNPKTSLGLVGVPLAILDEPAALHTVGGTALWDSVRTAQGKVGSPLKVILTGTLAPAAPGSWWHVLVEGGTTGSTNVQLLQGRRDKWDDWREITRVNPLARHHAELADVLREERGAAQRDSRLKASFCSMRLNLPTADESTALLTVGDWELVAARPVPPREGKPVVALDLGGGRAWSAALAWWPNGRVEALALAPGIPGIEAQERRDRVPRGTYGRLVDLGVLRLADGLRVPSVTALVDMVRPWNPRFIVCDRFQLDRLRDASRGIRLEPRITRWSESTADIMALRKMAGDGPLAVEEDSRLLIEASLTAAMVKSDDAGSTRIVKRDPANNCGRDDVAVCLALAAGAFSRLPTRPRGRYLGKAA